MFHENYSALPIPIVVDLIANLNLSNLQILSKYFKIHEKVSLFTVFHYKKDYINFIIVSANSDKLQFYGVNYQETLLNCWILDTITKVPITTTRGVISLHWRDYEYKIPFHLPSKCTSFDNAKASIVCLFTLPSFSFVLCNYIVIHFTWFKDKIFPSFIGHFENEKIISDTEWDFSQNILIGKIYKNIVYILNDSSCLLSNQYPEVKEEKNENIIIGNAYNYLVGKNNNISSITYAYTKSFSTNELNGNELKTIFFKDFIHVHQTKFFFIGVINPNLYSNTSYAVLGSCSFQDTKSSCRTTSLPIEYVSEKNETFQQEDTMFFKLLFDKMLIFQDGFRDFILKHTANQALSNINLYDSTKFKYNYQKNKLLSIKTVKKMNPLLVFTNPKIKNYYDKLPYSNNKHLPKKIPNSPVLHYFGKPYQRFF